MFRGSLWAARRPIWVLGLVTTLLIASSGTAAEPAEERASRQCYERGVRAYDAGRYEDAYRDFEEGYALSPRPGFILNMAHAQRRLGSPRKARALYQRYLLAEPDSHQVEAARTAIAELDELIKADDEATRRAEPVPAPPPAPPPPPPSAAPLPAPALLSTAPAPPSVAAPPHTRRWYARWWVWTAGVVVLGGAVTALAIAMSGPGYTQHGTLGAFGEPDL